jgi:hypothetical protein
MNEKKKGKVYLYGRMKWEKWGGERFSK